MRQRTTIVVAAGWIAVAVAAAHGQLLDPFVFSRSVYEPPGLPSAVPAREAWSTADHAAVVASAVSAAAALPDRSRARSRIRLVAVLRRAGDKADSAKVLADAAGDPRGTGYQVAQLARELVEAGDVDAARSLLAKADGDFDRHQLISGMLEGALKVGDLTLGLELIRVMRRMPHQSGFDPNAFQAKQIAERFAAAGRWREALAAFPADARFVGGGQLAALAQKACKADPSFGQAAGRLLAGPILRTAAGQGSTPQATSEIEAFESCRGAEATRRLVALLPADVAERLQSKSPRPIDNPENFAAEAEAAGRQGDQAGADRLFGLAESKLRGKAADRGQTIALRRSFDADASAVAVALYRSGRSDAALDLVSALPAIERLPILFRMADAAARAKMDTTVLVTAIDDIFAGEPALIEIEAGEIRSLLVALPFGAPTASRVQAWADKLPLPAPALYQVPVPTVRGTPPPGSTLEPLFAALEKAAPSVVVVRKVIAEAQRHDIKTALVDAKALTLTPHEEGARAMLRIFIEALPPDYTQGISDVAGVGAPATVAAVPSDDLIFVVERLALAQGDRNGARDAFAALSRDSILAGSGAAVLALDEASDGLPQSAKADLARVTYPAPRFAVLIALAAVKPSN